MFTITEEAVQALEEWSGQKNVMIRFRITTPCCNERKYDLSITDTMTTQDAQYVYGPIHIIYHPADLPYLKGTSINFRNNGFYIQNPHPLVQPF